MRVNHEDVPKRRARDAARGEIKTTTHKIRYDKARVAGGARAPPPPRTPPAEAAAAAAAEARATRAERVAGWRTEALLGGGDGWAGAGAAGHDAEPAAEGRLDDALVAAADEPTDEGAGAGEAGAAGGRGSAAGARKRRRGEGESEVSGGEGDDDVVVVDLTTSGDDGAQAASGEAGDG